MQITFTVIRRAIVNDGTASGLPVRVIQEPGPANGYAVIVSDDGRIGWVMPEQLR